MTISGRTRLYGILADPIAQVRTPQAFNALCAARGFDAVLVPFQVAPDDLATAVAGLRWLRSLGGLVVTVPHKRAMAALCDRLEPMGRLVGAVNAVRREADGSLLGENFDGRGFVAGLRAQGREPRGRRALLLGAGGAGAAIAFALAEAGVAELAIANRSAARGEALAAAVAAAFPGVAVRSAAAEGEGFDLLVNATSLGLRPEDPLPLPADSIPADALVAEVVMQPEVTALLRAAAARGAATHGGLHMLHGQLQAIAAFLGVPPA